VSEAEDVYKEAMAVLFARFMAMENAAMTDLEKAEDDLEMAEDDRDDIADVVGEAYEARDKAAAALEKLKKVVADLKMAMDLRAIYDDIEWAKYDLEELTEAFGESEEEDHKVYEARARWDEF